MVFSAIVSPHLVLLDWMMPETDGLLGKALYERYGPTVPIILSAR